LRIGNKGEKGVFYGALKVSAKKLARAFMQAFIILKALQKLTSTLKKRFSNCHYLCAIRWLIYKFRLLLKI
jgi:hypothetical protein